MANNNLNTGGMSDVKNKATEVGHRVQETATAAAHRAQETGTALMDKAKDIASSVADNARSAMGSAGDKASQAYDAVSGAVSSGMRTVGDKASDVGAYFSETDYSTMASDLTNLIRRNPIPAILIGVGIGYLLARSTSRS